MSSAQQGVGIIFHIVFRSSVKVVDAAKNEMESNTATQSDATASLRSIGSSQRVQLRGSGGCCFFLETANMDTDI